jgi:hypothetical protein
MQPVDNLEQSPLSPGPKVSDALAGTGVAARPPPERFQVAAPGTIGVAVF